MGYQILEHTADMRLRVWGKDQAELFSQALRAMMEIIKPAVAEAASFAEVATKAESAGKARKIKIQAPDITALLVDFLNEALNLSQTNKEVYKEVSFQKLTNTSLEAKLAGASVGRFDKDVKAVTYHEAEVKRNDKGEFETNLVFDI